MEAVAILPQLFLVSKTGEAESITSHYLFALGSYRALYLLNWVYRYYMEGFHDWIAITAGVVQTILYCDFFYLYVTRGTSATSHAPLHSVVAAVCSHTSANCIHPPLFYSDERPSSKITSVKHSDRCSGMDLRDGRFVLLIPNCALNCTTHLFAKNKVIQQIHDSDGLDPKIKSIVTKCNLRLL